MAYRRWYVVMRGVVPLAAVVVLHHTLPCNLACKGYRQNPLFMPHSLGSMECAHHVWLYRGGSTHFSGPTT